MTAACSIVSANFLLSKMEHRWFLLNPLKFGRDWWGCFTCVSFFKPHGPFRLECRRSSSCPESFWSHCCKWKFEASKNHPWIGFCKCSPSGSQKIEALYSHLVEDFAEYLFFVKVHVSFQHLWLKDAYWVVSSSTLTIVFGFVFIWSNIILTILLLFSVWKTYWSMHTLKIKLISLLDSWNFQIL